MDPGQLLNHALGWLWNNTYFSFVPLFEILAEPEVRKRILRHLPLRSLLNCCSVARELRNWALVQLRVSAHEFGPLPRRTTPHSSCGQATPLVVLVGGLTTDWSFVEVRVPSPMMSFASSDLTRWPQRALVLDCVGAEWHQTAPMQCSRIRSVQTAPCGPNSPNDLCRACCSCCAVGLANRRVLVAGGMSAVGLRAEARSELLDPVTMRWSLCPPIPTPRLGLAGCALGTGRQAIFTGGVTCDPAGGDGRGMDVVELFDLEQREWRALPPSAPLC